MSNTVEHPPDAKANYQPAQPFSSEITASTASSVPESRTVVTSKVTGEVVLRYAPRAPGQSQEDPSTT